MARLKERLNSPFIKKAGRFSCELNLLHFSINIKLFIMNKKFSTLLAGVALLTSSSAMALVQPTVKVDKLPAVSDCKLYQLANSDGSEVLVLDSLKSGDTFLGYQLKMEPIATAKLFPSLWSINVKSENLGRNPIFDFTNKAYGVNLDINEETLKAIDASSSIAAGTLAGAEAMIDGNINGWKFSVSYLEDLQQNQPLYSYTSKQDSVALLTVSGGKVYTVKVKVGQVGNVTDALKLTAFKPANVTLTAEDLNTKLGMLKSATPFELKFTPAVTNNVFEQKLIANEIAGSEYVTLNTVDANNAPVNYLRVDTAYLNTSGYKFLKITDNTKIADKKAAGDVLDKQYNFKFVYSPAADSIWISVESAIFAKDETTGYWKDGTAISAPTDADKLFIYAQDLGTEKAITVGSDNISTNVTLGLSGCGIVPETDATSIANGVYTIMNKKGQYLGVPVFSADSTEMWVTLNDATVNHMPAYQWIVLKNKQNDPKNVSPISYTNREFSTKAYVSSIQLSKKDGKYYMNGQEVVFEQVPEQFVKDSYLGYRNLDTDSLLVNTYVFNYMHPYSTEKYIGIHSTDSLIDVLDAKTAFAVSKNTLKEYGYDINLAKAYIPSLAQLKRSSYTLKVKDGSKKTGYSLYVDEEGQFVASKEAYGNKATTFYFKDNNDLEGTCYYALIDTVGVDAKAGVTENDMQALLKSQELAATYTSVFAIERNDAPIYRRFNTAKEVENAGDDEACILKFYNVNTPNESLGVEANPAFKVSGIDFLGMESEKDATGYGMYVDTAWVKRGVGYIKPQYLLSIDRQEYEGTTIIPCPIHGENCEHATTVTKKFRRGSYLFNMTDSVAAGNKDYVWQGYTRLAFIDAIHEGDSLYLLVDQFANLANKDIDLDKIIEAEKAYRKDNNIPASAYKGRYIVNLREDNHKVCTFSFRFTEPDKYAQDTDYDNFLIESLAKDPADKIQPSEGQWIMNKNNVMVLTDESVSSFDQALELADVFNIKKTDKIATDAVAPEVSTISVIATDGAVIIKGAEGKTVAISNVLGQTIANTVISSSEATISVPAGIVFVAVEGESAVKAIIK